MTYYTASQYKERWFIRFKDFKDGDWRISIEDPTFTGTATELTGAENPFEWMGQRDEDQTACVCGSTGYVRIVVTPDGSPEPGHEADIANLRPTELNNRRVTAKRNDTLVWQGFLKQEEYSQDWLSAPYEIELPIVSPLELANEITLPPYEDVISKNIRFIYQLIPYMAELLGISVPYLISNYQNHVGLNGYEDKDSNGNSYQWISGRCNIEHFYTFGETSITPKTIYDVLETIFYPWGRLTEMGSNWTAITFNNYNQLLFRFDFSNPTAYMQEWRDGSGNQKQWTNALFSDIEICSTDNTKSYIAAPSGVTFKTGMSENTSIVNLGDNSIKSTFNPSLNDIEYSYDDDKKNIRYRCMVSSDRIQNQQITMSGGQWYRVMGVKIDFNKDVSQYQYEHSMPAKLGILVTGTSTCTITVKQRLACDGDHNQIKKTFTIFNENGWEVDDDTELYMDGYKLCGPQNKFIRSGNSFTSVMATHNIQDTYDTFKLEFKLKSNDSSKKYIVVPHIEYQKTITNNSVARLNRFRAGIFQKEYYTQGNGNGDSLSIDFKTLVGGATEAIANICVPFNGFNDSMSLVDMQPRWKLELSEVRTADPLSLHLTPTLIIDNTTRYIIAATGMNARNCTTRLTLVSTNL